MRISARLLAGLLSLLMLCGLLPFSLFAVEATDTDTEASESESGKSYAESVADYVSKAKGTLYYANDFSSLENPLGVSVNSLVGGSMSLGIVPKAQSITAADGALLIESKDGADDPFVQFGPSGVNGQTMIVEASFKAKAPTTEGLSMSFADTNLIIAQEYYGADGKTILAYPAVKLVSLTVTGDDGNQTTGYYYTTAANKKILAAVSTEEYVNIKCVYSFANAMLYYYVNGEYWGTDIIQGSATLKNTSTMVYNPSIVRLVQLPKGTGAESGIYLDDLYVYTASVPYGCEEFYSENSYIENTLVPYLSSTGNRIIAGSDFEGTHNYKIAGIGDHELNNTTGTLTAGSQLFDARYNLVTGEFTTVVDGTQWYMYSAAHGFTSTYLNFHNKLTLGTLKQEDGNTYLSVEQEAYYANDSYVDLIPYNYKGGDFVLTVSLRNWEDTNWGGGIFNLVDRSGSAVWYAIVSRDTKGQVYATDYSTGKAVNVYFAQLYTTEFTTISIAVDVSENTADLYCNGYKVATITLDPAKPMSDFRIDGVRCTVQYQHKSGSWDYVGGVDVDNYFMYTGTTPVEANGLEPLSGWVQDAESGYWRYYKDGRALIGEQTIGGTTYYFERNGGYVSQKTTTSLVDLYATFTQGNVNGDNLISQLASKIHLLPSSTIKGSGAYTYLWADLYTKHNDKIAGNYLQNISLDSTATFNNGAWNVKFNTALAVTKDSDKISPQSKRAMKDGKTYYDLSDYDGLEIVSYIDITEGDIKYQLVLATDNVNDKTYGYTTNWDSSLGTAVGGADKICNLNSTCVYTSANNGWNVASYWFQSAFKTSGATHLGMGRSGSIERFLSMSFNVDWSNYVTTLNGVGYDTAKFYFDSISVFKYEPVTTIPGTGVSEKDGSLYYYSKTHTPATGWIDADSDGNNDYYAYPYSSKLATGYAIVDDLGMEFGADGKFVGKLNGRYTVNGIDSVYIDGKLQLGAFEYNGVNYYAGGNGKIISENGAIGYIYDKAYVKNDYSAVSNFMISENFDSKAVGTVYGNYSGSNSGNSLSYTSGANISLAAKGTHFTIVEKNGNNALEITNTAERLDSYVNVNYKANKGTQTGTGDNAYCDYTYVDSNGKSVDAVNPATGNGYDLVFEYDIMLGEDWNADVTAFLPIATDIGAGARSNTLQNVARINNQGYLYPNNESTKILCKLSTEEYTNLAFVCHCDTRTCDIYVNGVLMYAGKSFKTGSTPSHIIITEGRFLQYPQNNSHGTAYIDNIYSYMASTPLSYDGTTAIKEGWKTEGGVQRYYESGLMRTSALEIDGVYYYFDSLNGVCTGTANGWIGSNYYKDGRKLTSQWLNDSGKTYYLDAEGNALKGAASVDGAVYYFNASTGVLEKRGESETLLDITRLLNGHKSYTIDYSNVKGDLTASINMHGFKNGFSSANHLIKDISGYGAVSIDIWVEKEYDADFGLAFYNPTYYFEATDVVLDENNNCTSAKLVEDGEKLTSKSGLVDLKKYRGIDGINYRIYYREEEGGNRTYFFEKSCYFVFWSASNNCSLEKLQPGWNTVVFDFSKVVNNNKADLTNISSVTLLLSGWSINGNGEYAEGANDFNIRLGEVNLIKYVNVLESATTGWVDGKFYKDSTVPTTGWFEYDEVKYYADAEGNIVTGNVYIDGKYYSFDEGGKYVGLVSGIVEVEIAKKVDGTWKNVTVKRIYKDGEYQTGVVSYDSKTYICDENSGEMVVDTTLLVGDTVYDCGADGVASKHAKAWYTDANGNVYYTKSSGKITTGGAVIDDDTYFFGDDGIMQTEVFFEYRKNTYYAGADGKAVKNGVYDVKVTVTGEDGSTTVETKKAYFNEKGVWSTDNEAYEYDENGYVTGDKQPATHEHDYSKANKDSEYHWNECAVCGAIDESSKEAHKGGNATCTEKANCESCGEAYGDLAAHDYSKANKDSEYHWNECAVCGAIDESSKAAHDYSIENKDETYKWNECSCGAIDESSKTEIKTEPEPEENYTVTIEIIYPDKSEKTLTFTEKVGSTFTYTADEFDCHTAVYKKWNGKKYVTVSEISCTDETEYWVYYTSNHDWASVIALPATCTTAGRTAGSVCRNCGEYTYTVIASLGHDIIDVPEVDATCVKNGHTAGTKCSRCDECNDYTVIKATGHNYDSGVVGDDSSITYTCSKCGDTKVYEATWGEVYGIEFDGEHYTYNGVKSQWVKFSDGYRYFDANGYLVIGTSTAGNCTIGNLGVLQTGNITYGGYTYMIVNGILRSNCTDMVGMTCYEFDYAGRGTPVSTTGKTETVDGAVYVQDSGLLLRNSWVEIDGDIYFFGKDNKMATGTYVISGVTYTFGEDGKLESATDCISNRGDAMVYIKADGTLARSEWVEIEGNKYYFNRNNEMVTGEFVIGGVTYNFDENGVLIG